MTTPEIGSRWQHRNGNVYTVLHIANIPDEERYPKTIVYQGPDGKVWTRRADDWHRSMTALDNPVRTVLRLLLDHIDYENGACRANEMIGAILPADLLQRAREESK